MSHSFRDRFLPVRIDAWLGASLILFLVGLTLAASMANIQTDALDYFVIVQRLVGDEPAIVSNAQWAWPRWC